MGVAPILCVLDLTLCASTLPPEGSRGGKDGSLLDVRRAVVLRSPTIRCSSGVRGSK